MDTSVDDRIILIGLDENGCECAGNISLFQYIVNWRDFMLLTDTEQEWALPQGRTNNDVFRSTASSPAIERALCVLQIVREGL